MEMATDTCWVGHFSVESCISKVQFHSTKCFSHVEHQTNRIISCFSSSCKYHLCYPLFAQYFYPKHTPGDLHVLLTEERIQFKLLIIFDDILLSESKTDFCYRFFMPSQCHFLYKTVITSRYWLYASTLSSKCFVWIYHIIHVRPIHLSRIQLGFHRVQGSCYFSTAFEPCSFLPILSRILSFDFSFPFPFL